jgi:hypothetical protein
MNMTFEIDGKYTLVFIWRMAITIRNEIVVTNIEEAPQRYKFKNRGKMEVFLLPAEDDLQKHLIFEGHDLPFTVDSEADRVSGNALFNFVTDEPDDLKLLIKKYCLNPSLSLFARIFYAGFDRDSEEEPVSFPLFPENDAQQLRAEL